MVIDQFNDPAYAILARQAKAMPAFAAQIKTASLDPDEVHALPDDAFAWPEKRRFPVHSADHATLSMAYVKAASEKMPAYVLESIKEALDVYGVNEQIFASETYTKVAEEVPYAYPELKKLPMRNADELLRSERALHEHTKLAYALKHDIAANLAEQARKLHVKLQPKTMKLAGLTVGNTAAAVEWLEARAHIVKDAGVKVAFEELARELPKYGPRLANADAMKFAAVVGQLDERGGLQGHYGRKLPNPLETIFNTEKIASEDVDVGNGAFVSLAKLAALPASFWEDLDGKELANAIAPGGVVDSSKLAAIVETLPADLKAVLRGQMRV